MADKRFYVIVPKSVQVVEEYPVSEFYLDGGRNPASINKVIKSIPMCHGRLMAQNVHIGRKVGHLIERLGFPYEDTTTIVLSVRNSKELSKVSNEIANSLSPVSKDDLVVYEEFHDHNPEFYGTQDKVHTITIVGPVSPEGREKLESAIGHLDLY